MEATQRSFGKGELAPTLWGRTDIVAYATGLRTCRNFTVTKAGGVENRPGTQLAGATNGNSRARLLPFVFNDAQTYCLEFTDRAVRFLRAGAYVGSPYTLVTPYLASELPALKYVQSADVMTLVHPNHPPMNLSRLGDTSWTLTAITFTPSIAPPASVTLIPPGALSTYRSWVVTAIDATTGQESFPSTATGYALLSAAMALPSIMVTWAAVPNASAYNIYKATSAADGDPPGDYGFIGSTGELAFRDSGLTPDILNRAPVPRTPFSGTGNAPSAVAYYQGRALYADTTNAPETVFTSRSADYGNFTVSSPSQDDDALTFTLASRTVSAIQHIHTNASLLLFTASGEWIVNGDSGGVLRPTDINALNFSSHGCSLLAPIQIDARVLFVQGRQAIVRDLARDYYYGYRGTDLTVTATHLFRGHQLVDWAYQENPDSIVWAVRDDGVLLGMTDVAEQQMTAWHRHDTLGAFENVCAIPEGGIDAVYVVVNRNGTRYTERFTPRFFTDVQDCVFMDSALSYDGRNTDAGLTMTLSGSTSWEYDEGLTCTCSAPTFASGDVGNAVFLTSTDGTQLRFKITGYSSATVVTGFPAKTVPADLQGHATSAWARAVDQVSGLSHLEGRAVSVFADGYVVASPNNPTVSVQVVVSGGIATLDQPYAYIHVGLPYVSDLETLAIDTAQGASLKTQKAVINRLDMPVADSRGVFAGPDAPDTDLVDIEATGGTMIEYKQRNHEDYSVPVALRTGTIEMNIPASWKRDGHVFVRQADPIPLTILGVSPSGFIPAA